MQKILLLFCCFLPCLLLAQISEKKNEIGMGLDIRYASSSFSNSFLQKIIQGGHISDNEKEDWSKRINDDNFFQAEARCQIYGLFTLEKHPEHKLGFLMGTRFHTDGNFSKELWTTALYGNTTFGTALVNIGEARFNYLNYSDLSILYQSKRWELDKKRTQCWITSSVGLRLGHQFIKIEGEKLYLQTEELASELHFEGEYGIGFASKNVVNGYGANIDFGFHLKGTFNKKNEWQFNVSTKDLGFIFWNKNSYRLNQESKVTFDGFHFSNISHATNSIRSEIDSLKGIFTENAKNEGFIYATPASIHLSAALFFHEYEPLLLGISGHITCTVFATPYYKLQLTPFIGKHWQNEKGSYNIQFGLPVSYNNFSGLGVGGKIEFVHLDERRLGFKLGCEAGVLGFVSAATFATIHFSFLFD